MRTTIRSRTWVRTSRGLELGCLAAMAAILALGGCQSDEEKIAAFRERADQYVEQGKDNEAIIEYRNVIKLDPNDAAAHYALAEAFMRTQNLKQAYWELSETVRLDPGHVAARLQYGGLSLAARDFKEALAQGEAVIELDPEKGEAHVLKARGLEGLGEEEGVLDAYLAAVRVEPDNRDMQEALANYYQRVEDFEAAQREYEALAERFPDFRSYTLLGWYLGRQRRPRDLPAAEPALQKALELADEEQKPKAYINLAHLYMTMEKGDEAQEILEEGIEQSADKVEVIYLLARLHLARGEQEKADELIEQAAASAPDDPDPQLVLSAYRSRRGDSEGALAAVERALEIAPDHVPARLRRAELLIDRGYRGEDSEALAQGATIVSEVLDAEPTNADALFVLGKLELAQDQPETAVVTLRSAIDARPDEGKYHFVLGSTLAHLRDFPSARAELARALELEPSLLDARRLLTRVHYMLSEHEYAIEQGRLYLRAKPDHNRTRILVAQSLIRLGKRDEAYEELLKIPEENRGPDTLYAIARIQLGKGQLEESEALLVRADEERPNHADVLRTLYEVQKKLGRREDAVARINAAAEANPEDAKLMQLRGTIAWESGDLEAAEKDFKRASELAPKDLSAYRQLAEFYRRSGRVEETLAILQKGIEERPDAAELHHFTALLYELQGNPDAAIEHYERAIEIDSSLGDSKNNLAYLLAERGESLDRALDLAQEAKAQLPDSANAADTLGWVLYKRGIPSAAVGYLREAEAGMNPEAVELGIVRHHLALAYEANGERGKAIESLDRAVEDLDRRAELARERGVDVSEPSWAVELRAMADRLKTESSQS